MLTMRPMRADEFPAYLSYFIADYAAEIAANFGLSAEASSIKASEEIAANLPDGVSTPEASLICLTLADDAREQLVGYLWYSAKSDDRSAFVYDFYIRPEYRGQGLGRQALALLETELTQAGIEQIRLRVAADNDGAKRLYENTGFRVTGINMSKLIGKK
ncbi:GNAT family N-acetyltransferase [Consotaella salsifontis]|uniref:Acetyltransferase (GNAT) family protein n=1 Tax=Consotaella salsifontis TaxID=1365950 RepID=A0A1T4N4Q7_9HYPH|nr:GNAT family N-acetyltransferase [Consotaella salsifontis]SJZ74340.1 Acetyltransferase (GNAT) family protein [Consotaella salsifontis]